MQSRKYRYIEFIFCGLFVFCLCACSTASWLESHGIEKENVYSEESIAKLIDIINRDSGSGKDWLVAASVLSRLRVRNDEIANVLYDVSVKTDKYSFLMSASVYFINNSYIDYAVYTLGRLLAMPRYKTSNSRRSPNPLVYKEIVVSLS